MKKLVLLDQDGGIDDYLSTVLLMTMENVEPLGVVVTPADCYLQPAVSATRKILDLMQCFHIPVAASTIRGVNPFPPLYRRDSFIINNLPILNETELIKTPLVKQSGQQFIVEVLKTAKEPVTLMVTGPLTTVAEALKLSPEIESKIAELVWMGGAINVPGNVSREWEPGQDGSAEWNAYFDPFAVEQVWKTNIPIILCSLDLTNTVPITASFLKQLAHQRRYPISDFAGQCYAVAIAQDYYFWDVLATTYLAHPEWYQLKTYETIVVTEGVSQGCINVTPRGRKIQVMVDVKRDRFYRYLLQQWQR
ncbi:MAG: nucleoside hydrolase [Cyanobacteria bacterium J06592_8]